MANLLQRDDPRYKEIESFESYELTPCIAYEMAMRNKEVMRILEKLDYIKELQERHPYLTIFTGRFLSISDELSNKYKELALKDLNELREILEKAVDKEKTNKYCPDWYDKFDNSIDGKQMNGAQINKYIYGDLNIKDDETQLCDDYLRIIVTELQNDLVSNYRVYPDGYVMNYQGADEDYLHEVNNKKFDNIGTTFDGRTNESIQKGFCILQEINQNGNTYTINHIVPNFERKVNAEQILIALDLSRPIEEIEAYISHIKITLKNSDERIMKLSNELMGGQLEKAADILNMSYINSKGTKKTFESRWGSQLQQKFADMFFIYDAVNAGMKKSAILNNIDTYHDPDNKRKYSFHPDTYSKYLVIAKEYIENKKYLELITGAKPKNISS